jgi:Xaa-Pro aminopeptidase
VLDGLRTSFPGAAIVRADEIMVKLRSVKSEAEIACLKEAFRISELTVDAILDEIEPGMTELQVVGIAQSVIYANGAEYEGMPQYVLSGSHTNHAISRPTHKVLEPGDLVQLNISARVAGYSSGVGRPVCLGKMTGRMRELVAFGKEARERTIEWMRASAIASEIAQRYHELFVAHGYECNYLYGPCHGLGMIEVEPPWMETTSDYRLVENMTFQVDTFVQDAAFGLRWENGARVTSDGVELFSNRNMDLIEL